VTFGRCPACLPCLAPDCERVAACMDHPSEPMCEHDWRGCEEHPCERCAEESLTVEERLLVGLLGLDLFVRGSA
jgi:hypothetical protein